MGAAWGWTGIVKGHLAGSPGFPALEDEIYMMPLERVLHQMKYLNDEAATREAEAKQAQEDAERQRREKEAANRILTRRN
jgi:hypothetical protein